MINLTNPPGPEELKEWDRERIGGRWRYVVRNWFYLTLFLVGVQIVAKTIYFWVMGEFDPYSGLPLFFGMEIYGWLLFRWKWQENEQIYLATKQKADSSPQS
jgi:hypothetical protein